MWREGRQDVAATNFCSREDAYTTSYYCGETDEFTSNLYKDVSITSSGEQQMYAISSLSKLYVEPEDKRELRKEEKKRK